MPTTHTSRNSANGASADHKPSIPPANDSRVVYPKFSRRQVAPNGSTHCENCGHCRCLYLCRSKEGKEPGFRLCAICAVGFMKAVAAADLTAVIARE